MAKTTQLIMEYDPQPLFDAGIPNTVYESIVQSVKRLGSLLIEAF